MLAGAITACKPAAPCPPGTRLVGDPPPNGSETTCMKTVDGQDFTTADWKGKVVLVDFWAVWCGPCVASLPHVIEQYNKYHDQGLEIVGIDNDMKADVVTKFTTSHKMPWPQLFAPSEDSKNRFSPNTLQYGIEGIPTMFIIDKKGNCRSVEAREKMDDLIPKLLAE